MPASRSDPLSRGKTGNLHGPLVAMVTAPLAQAATAGGSNRAEPDLAIPVVAPAKHVASVVERAAVSLTESQGCDRSEVTDWHRHKGILVRVVPQLPLGIPPPTLDGTVGDDGAGMEAAQCKTFEGIKPLNSDGLVHLVAALGVAQLTMEV